MSSETRQITHIQPHNRLNLSDLFFTLSGAYGAIITLFLFLREIIGESWTLLALFNSGAHLLLMLAVLGLLVGLVARRWNAALLLAPSALFFFLSYGALFLPQSAASVDDERQIALLTYNLYSKRADPPQLVQVITEVDADIVLVQELGVEVAAYLERALAESYPHQALHPDPTLQAGMGVFSRYPIETDEYWRIHRGHQRVTITLGTDPVVIYNTRPIFPFEHGGFDLQREEVDVLLERTAQERGAVILAGDFNMNDQSENYRRITRTFTDSFMAVGWGMGFTFPAGNPDIDALPARIRRLLALPVVRLDYVFHNDRFQAVTAQVWPESGGSDHRPVYAVLVLAEE